MEISTGKNKQVSFGVGIVLIAVGCVALIWYTNPELITSWFRKTPLEGKIEWQATPKPGINVWNAGETEWKDVKITLNKSSVSQRYEFSVPSIKKHRLGFFVPAERFKKSNGEVYDTAAGAPHQITVEVPLGDGKTGSIDLKLGDKKI